MKYVFNRDLIMDDVKNDIYLKELRDYIVGNSMSSYNNWHWFANILKEIIEFAEDGYEKPIGLLNKIYSFRDLFPYNDIAYRGYKLDAFKEMPNLETGELCSWSWQKEVAYRFTEKSQGLWCVIKSDIKDGFYLAAFMSDLLEECSIDSIYNYFEGYFGEDEVLYPVNDFNIYESGDRCI